MRFWRWSLVGIAVIFTILLLVLPSYVGISLPDMTLELKEDWIPKEGPESVNYLILDVYYVMFVILNLCPFLVFFLWSFFSMAVFDERKGRKLKSPTDVPKEGSTETIRPKVSVIIPCYNEDEHVSRAIMSIFTQSYRGDIEVLVVDDGSTDDTWSISRLFVERTGGRTLRTIHKANGGKASALSLGAKNARGSIIVMTDGDSQLENDAIEEIVRTFTKHPDAGIVGGFVSIGNVRSGYLTRLQQFEYVITQHLIRMNQSDDGSVLIAPGPIFGIRSEIARSLNPLDRTIVEDCDLTMSVLETGWTTRSTRKAVSRTNAPTTWRAWIRQRKRWIFGQFQAWRENRWHLMRKPWAIYTYLTWVSTSVSALVFMVMLVLTGMFVWSGSEYYSYMEFISLRTGIILWVYFLTRGFILLFYRETRHLLHYLPLMVVYDMVAGLLTAYLYFSYFSGTGVRMRWGNRNEVVH